MLHSRQLKAIDHQDSGPRMFEVWKMDGISFGNVIESEECRIVFASIVKPNLYVSMYFGIFWTTIFENVFAINWSWKMFEIVFANM